MSLGTTAALSFVVAAGASLVATPIAIRIAQRTDFFDHPREYRKHSAPTPFLGGAAVLAAFLLAALLVAGASGKLLVPLGCALVLWMVGTVDDRIGLAPGWRLLVEAGAGAALFADGLGWDTSLGGAGDALLTIVSVVIAVNAFNLMDNMDGACSSVTAVAAAGIGVLAGIKGQTTVAGLAFALAGACACFLRWNLAKPARIFLGDGGSMPIGFLVVALVMATAWHSGSGDPAVLVGGLLIGLPIFDTTLVSYSRLRRGVTLLSGGRDHLTHRLLLVLRTPRAVAATLAVLQAGLSALAILAFELGATAPAWVGLGVFICGVIAVVALDSPRWQPAGIAVGMSEPRAASGHHPPGIEEA
jgi:UDP-GlcNAc:undecaprenyl-phosphate/decaprenyl-phosphate GlcNAc-1-phosphate transferase